MNILANFNNAVMHVKKESVKLPNNRYQEEDNLVNKNVFEIKRRSCGPAE